MDLADRQEIEKLVRAKRKRFYEESIKKSLLDNYLNDGWEYIRETIRTVRVKKNKNLPNFFEDRVWSLFADMGFEKMNRNSNFKLPYLNNTSDPGRQIDIYAEDSETIIIVECKTSEKLRSKSLQTVINDLQTVRVGIINYLNKINDNPKKVKFILATYNITLNDPDLIRLKEHNIVHLNEDGIEYFELLTSHLGKAAKYQLLGLIFKGQTISGLKNKVPAIRGEMGGYKYFSFSIEPEILLKLSYILHSSAINNDSLGSYQRMVSKTRIKQIGNYLDDGGYFPNSIIINIETDREKDLSFDNLKAEHDSKSSDVCVLHLPKKYQSAFIIDGQHRLYGYSNSMYKNTNSIPVVAFVNLPPEEQVQMFVDINHKQKSVSKNLLTTIVADLKFGSDNYKEAIFALKSRLLQKLGQNQGSPLYKRIVIGEIKRTKITCLTLDYLISYGLNKSLFFARISRGKLQETGPLWIDGHYHKMLDKAYEYFAEIFKTISLRLERNWKLGNNEGGVVSTNVGVMSIIRICGSILAHLKTIDKIDLYTSGGKNLAELTIKYLEPVLDYFEELDFQGIKDLKSAGTGGIGRDQIFREFQKIINDRYSHYKPEGLQEWITNNSGTHNQTSKELIDEIEKGIHQSIKNILKKEYGHQGNDWFQKGIPQPIQEKTYQLHSKDKFKEEQFNYLYIVDYQAIIGNNKNWQLMKNIFSDPNWRIVKEDVEDRTNKKLSQKEASLYWFKKLNDIRKKVSHPTRSPVTKMEYDFLNELSGWLMPRLSEHLS